MLNNKLKSIEKYAITTSACWVWLETFASSKVLIGIESFDDVRAIPVSAFFGPGFRTIGSFDVDWRFRCFVFYTKLRKLALALEVLTNKS